MNSKTRMTCVLAGILFVLFSLPAHAQVGYQVSLLNSATGEPRANVTVSAQVKITDSKGTVICSEMKQATSNDFGVLSLMVGKEDSFKDVDTGALPLFIEVTVDGKLIGKTQILSVPVAEIATKLKSSFTKEDLVGTWDYVIGNEYEPRLYTFRQDNTGKFPCYFDSPVTKREGNFEYEIDGNNVYLYVTAQCWERRVDVDGNDSWVSSIESYAEVYRWKNGILFPLDSFSTNGLHKK